MAFDSTLEAASISLQERTVYMDGKWMAAHGRGCRQFVILAAGLDARAWRLPLDAGCTVYEVDVPAAHAYKAALVPAVAGVYPDGPACRRVCVEADLSQAAWPALLTAAGFDPAQQSFFLIEGLLMYLPAGAPQQVGFGFGLWVWLAAVVGG